MRNIYDTTGFDSKEYGWNKRAHRLAVTYTVLQYVLWALTLALLAWAFLWMLGILRNGGLGILPCLGVLASVAALNICMQVSLARLFENSSLRLNPDERHDWLLYEYHHGGRRYKRRRSDLLLALARMDLLRQRHDLARLALGEADVQDFDGIQLKTYDLLWIATSCLDGNRDEAETWLVRYRGFSAGNARHATSQDLRFPSDSMLTSWIAGQATEQVVLSAIAQLGESHKTSPVLPALFGAMLAHLIFFASVWLGADSARGWYVRIPYLEIGGTLAAIFLVVLAGRSLYLIHSLHRSATSPARGFRKVPLIIGRIAIMGIALLLAAYMLLATVLDTDGTERIIATAQVDSSSGISYDYLAVDRNGYDPGEALTQYYRAGDIILMESWGPASQYDSKGVEAPANDSGASSSGTPTTPDGSQNSSADTGNEDDSSAESTQQDSSQGGLFSSERGYSQAVRNQMQAVYLFIESEGTLSDMSFSLGADAKGVTYATVSSGSEDRDGTQVSYEYRLYDNGEAVSDGSVWEEIVLEKVYPEGSYDTELVDFYLLDPVSLEVRDEHRTSW